MRVYLDDIRPIPEGWVGCRTAQDAMELIVYGKVKEISFDHDLGTKLTGYDVAAYIEKLVYAGLIIIPKWMVHSSNPVGRKRIEQAMTSAERYSKRG